MPPTLEVGMFPPIQVVEGNTPRIRGTPPHDVHRRVGQILDAFATRATQLCDRTCGEVAQEARQLPVLGQPPAGELCGIQPHDHIPRTVVCQIPCEDKQTVRLGAVLLVDVADEPDLWMEEMTRGSAYLVHHRLDKG